MTREGSYPEMKILIYGAGAVGSFYGALLARGGHDVHVVARGTQLDAIRAQGIEIRSRPLGDIRVPSVSAVERATEAGEAPLAVVCVKVHQTAAILDDLAAAVGRDTIILPLQNGIETDEELAARFGWARVVTAVVYVGVSVDVPAVVTHVANGLIVIGARPGFEAARLPAVREALAVTGLPVRISDNIQQERWRKLVWNASFNPVSALAQRAPKDLLAAPESRAQLVGLMLEVIAVALAQGVALHDSVVDDQVTFTETTPGIRTSMEIDRERGRAMETEALVGVIVRKGREAGVATPLTETVYALLNAVDSAP